MMKKKIVSIFVCKLMIVATVISISVTGMINNIPRNTTSPDIEWDVTFGSNKIDWGCNVQQTFDGGYIISGTCDRYQYTPWQGYGYLLKIDSNGNEEWNQIFQVSNWEVVCQSVQQTDDDEDHNKNDGYIIAGYTGYTWQIDLFIAKTDVNGNILWTKIMGDSEAFDRGNSVQQTKDGGYIIAGCTQTYGAGGSDAWLIKLDYEGNEEWNNTYGGTNSDFANSVKQTSDGGYIITGETDSYGLNGDIFLVKTDSLGNEEWIKTFGGNGWDGGNCVQQTTDKGYIITGWCTTTMGDHDIYLIKTDENGEEEWNKTFGEKYHDECFSVQQTAYGGYFLTGFSSTDPIHWLPEVYLLKTDSLGNEEWNKKLMKNEQNEGYFGKQTTDGGYIITGNTGNYSNESLDGWIIKLEGNNQAPVAPDINGPIKVNVNIETDYLIVTTDPDEDIVSYFVDWGDDTFHDWTEYSASGSEIILKHTWKEQGYYTIKLKAKDPFNAESNLSELEIEIPRNIKQNTHSFLLRFLERIQNIFNIKYIINIIRGI
jgi:hypothetical protein